LGELFEKFTKGEEKEKRTTRQSIRINRRAKHRQEPKKKIKAFPQKEGDMILGVEGGGCSLQRYWGLYRGEKKRKRAHQKGDCCKSSRKRKRSSEGGSINLRGLIKQHTTIGTEKKNRATRGRGKGDNGFRLRITGQRQISLVYKSEIM